MDDIKQILENNEKQKAEKVKLLKYLLEIYQDCFRKVNTFYINLNMSNPNNSLLPEIQQNVLDLKRKIIKFEQSIRDYEKVDW